MAQKKESVSQFFEQVYNDKSLQGALIAALCKAQPEAVMEIAKKKGHEFNKEDLEATVFGAQKGELSDKDLAGVSGGLASYSFNKLASYSLATNFWGNTLGGFGGLKSAFGLTIPGPTFVLVQTPKDHEGSVVKDEAPAASALDLYNELV